MDDDARVVIPTLLAFNGECNSMVIRISYNDGGEIVLEYTNSNNDNHNFRRNTPEAYRATSTINKLITHFGLIKNKYEEISSTQNCGLSATI